MMLYNIIRANTALPASTNDFMTIISGATRSFLIVEIDAEGDGNTSTYNEFGIYRVTTAGTTGGGAITPVPVDSPNMTGTTPAIAFSGTVDTTWTTQPTVGSLIHNVPINANGQRYFWRANPNLSNAIVVPGGNNAAGTVSVRPSTGTSNISLRIMVAEL